MAYCKDGARCTPNATEDVRSLRSTEFSCTWKVENFKHIHPGKGKYISIERSDEGSLWTVFLYPDGYDNSSTAFVSLIVIFDKKNYLQLNHASYQLSVYFLDREGREIEMHRSQEKRTNFVKLTNFVFKNFLFSEENSRNLIPGGTLTMRFKTIFLDEDVQYKPLHLASPYAEPDQPSDVGLASIFNDENFSDVKIVVGGQRFHVYKGVLACSSPVFAAMFHANMRESNENVVEINARAEVIEQLLRFVYSGRLEGCARDLLAELLAEAETYQIEQLKGLCEEKLIGELSVENASGLLILADKYRAEALKASALKFFKIHVKSIIKTKEFKRDLSGLTSVLPEMFETLAYNFNDPDQRYFDLSNDKYRDLFL